MAYPHESVRCPSFCDSDGLHHHSKACGVGDTSNMTWYCCGTNVHEMFCCTSEDLGITNLPLDVVDCITTAHHRWSRWNVVLLLSVALLMYRLYRHRNRNNNPIPSSTQDLRIVGPRRLERREELEEPMDSDTDEDVGRGNLEVETAHWTFTAFIVNECPADNDGPTQPVVPPAYEDVTEPPPSYNALMGTENQGYNEPDDPSRADDNPPPYCASDVTPELPPSYDENEADACADNDTVHVDDGAPIIG